MENKIFLEKEKKVIRNKKTVLKNSLKKELHNTEILLHIVDGKDPQTVLFVCRKD